MKTDYKFWYITRDDDGFIIKCTIRFYEGDITTEDEPDGVGDFTPVTKYRRINRLQEADLSHLGTGFQKEQNGNDSKVYTSKDFGSIKTDDELRTFLNNQIKLDSTRTVIDEQK